MHVGFIHSCPLRFSLSTQEIEREREGESERQKKSNKKYPFQHAARYNVTMSKDLCDIHTHPHFNTALSTL